jgi:hypothetical protein
MTQDEETRRVVESYFGAWTEQRTREAFALLAEDLHFAGPSARYDSAAAFWPALDAFARMTQSARMLELVVDGERAALLYDCELPEPVGTLRIASFFRVVDGKIEWYETFFDPTELRKLQAQRSATG